MVDGPAVDLSSALEALDDRVRVLRRPRGGPGGTRNTGCEAATGAVLAFLDSDDLWLPTKLERQIELLTDDPAVDVVFSGVEQFYSPELHRSGAPDRDAHAARSGFLPSAMVVRASSFRHVGGFREGVTFGELLDWYGRTVERISSLRPSTRSSCVRHVHPRNAGIRFRSAHGDYAAMVKVLLDRRRGAGH